MPTIDVVFPVTIRLDLATATNAHDLKRLRDDLGKAVDEACDPDGEGPHRDLAFLTPLDNLNGSYHVAVGKPTVELPEFLYEHAQASARVASIHPRD